MNNERTSASVGIANLCGELCRALSRSPELVSVALEHKGRSNMTLAITAPTPDAKRIVGKGGSHITAVRRLLTLAADAKGLTLELGQVNSFERSDPEKTVAFDKNYVLDLLDRTLAAVFQGWHAVSVTDESTRIEVDVAVSGEPKWKLDDVAFQLFRLFHGIGAVRGKIVSVRLNGKGNL